MKILNIKKNKKMYEVTLEKESILVWEKIFIQYELFSRKSIGEEELKLLKKDNEIESSFQSCCNYLEKKMRSEKEIRAYLKKKDVSLDIIDEVVLLLKEKHFLDEERFLFAYVNDIVKFTLYGPFYIEKKLMDLGISKENIWNRLSSINEEVWQEKIKIIIKKKVEKNKKDSEVILKNKCLHYCYSMGYPENMVKPLVEKIQLEDGRKRYAEEEKRLRKVLSRKYDGEELEFQLKKKLYQKGFSKEV